MPDKVLILGRGPSWTECPLDNELWGATTCLLEDGLKDLKFDKVFQQNGISLPTVATSVAIAHEKGIPIVSPHRYGDEWYPYKEIVKEFRTVYLKHSIPFMIAFAVYSGYKKIGLYGIDQGPAWNLVSCKPYITFWLGIAVGRGVGIDMGRHSLRWVYGTDGNNMPIPIEVNERFFE